MQTCTRQQAFLSVPEGTSPMLFVHHRQGDGHMCVLYLDVVAGVQVFFDPSLYYKQCYPDIWSFFSTVRPGRCTALAPSLG